MENIPLEQRHLSQFERKFPVVRHVNVTRGGIGIAKSLEASANELVIVFDWLIMDGRLLQDHTVHIPNPSLLEDSNRIVKIKHAGGTIHITDVEKKTHHP